MLIIARSKVFERLISKDVELYLYFTVIRTLAFYHV